MPIQRNLKIIGSFTSNGDVELAADMTTLRELRERLNDKALPLHFKLYAPTTPPTPYDDYLEEITFKARDGLLDIQIIGKALAISGSDENLQVLSDDIQWLIEQGETSPDLVGRLHLHVDYYPDHPYLASSNISLVICVVEK
jgi:hypothetical protein